MKTIRRVALLVLVVGVAGAAALVGTARPALDRAYDDATARWRAVAPALDERYEALAAVSGAVQAIGGNGAAVASEVDDGLERWVSARRGGDTREQVGAANLLEGLARRLAATIEASARLSREGAVGDALATFERRRVPDAGRAYNDAVDAYEEERNGVVRSVAAGMLGYRGLAHLDTGPPAG
jgi:hypothetical protein